MRYELHTTGSRSAFTLLSEHATYAEALDAGNAGDVNGRKPWAIVPSGTADELERFGNLDAVTPWGGYGGLYVMRSGGGFSCYGFDNLEREISRVVGWLKAEGQPVPALSTSDEARGSPERYSDYLVTMAAGREYHARTGRRCPAALEPQLVGLEGKRVEVTRNGETSRFIVGKSTGWMPIHLEIANRRSDGGPSVFGPFDSVRVVG